MTFRKRFAMALLLVIAAGGGYASKTMSGESPKNAAIFGFRDPTAEARWEKQFLAIPNPGLAEQHLRRLTQAPHMAGTPEDKATADYVAAKFREAGLETEIFEYRVWINYPSEISVDIVAPPDVHMHGPRREHVEPDKDAGDPYQDDPRVVMPFSAMSPSGDADAEVIYANYGTPEDFKKLEELKIDARNKIILVRYGQNFRGVKVLLAEQHGAAGVIIYSDPADDGWQQGDKYPKGPWRPDSGAQRGSVGYIFEYPGDPTTPGIASLPALPDSQRTAPTQSTALPRIPVTPLSYADASPILEHLAGLPCPHDWQGALPFTYHLGPGPVRVKLHSKQDYQYRTIWDVIGRVRGMDSPDDWVIAGNHRDAWVYGAVDPNSGTAAMLETAHGIGELLKSGWKPKRTIVFTSWDAEEFGLMGSTEWGEQHEALLTRAVAYFNMDAAVSGSKFGASSVPSLKRFLREIATAIPSPQGGTVYEAWRKANQSVLTGAAARGGTAVAFQPPANSTSTDVPVGELGSGSDYSVFLQHLGVPSTDIGSTGPYGVYHSVFDNFHWFNKFGDPDFLYEQQMARLFGLEALRMANADVLPFDYGEYGKEVTAYIDAASKKAALELGPHSPNFAEAARAARRFTDAGARSLVRQERLREDTSRLNKALSETERALLIPEGLPHRPWYRHAIYAPGEFTGYAAVVIPGVNEAIDKHDAEQTRQQLKAIAAALTRAAIILEGMR